jgi:outer membrane protein assembly factor BamB
VVGDIVMVAVGGLLAAYDTATGNPRWSGVGVAGGENYSSPHLMSIDGVEQVLLMSATGTTSVEPASGTVLWEYGWPGVPIVQPAQTEDGDVITTTAGGSGAVGLRRLAVAQGPGGWTVEERWRSSALKPYFNDFVVHRGHAFGFDGSILASVDLADGTRAWKGGRYGHGQLLLLSDQDLLLVLAEQGDLVLVEATPDGFSELSRFPAIEGKTWNHPILVDNLLLIRNDHEMAAFRLPLAGDRAASAVQGAAPPR